jgi:hypothetical protein
LICLRIRWVRARRSVGRFGSAEGFIVAQTEQFQWGDFQKSNLFHFFAPKKFPRAAHRLALFFTCVSRLASVL